MNDILKEEIKKYRKPAHSINELLYHRWSPRSMTGESISDEELMSLFEAARWAPSSMNAQPWRFIYAKRESKDWDRIFGILSENNQRWVTKASVLIVIISNREGGTHSLETGAAMENMALEAASRGLVMHPMGGFDYDKAKTELQVPDEYKVEAMAAIGIRDKVEALHERLQKREFPSDRKPVEELIMKGKFDSSKK